MISPVADKVGLLLMQLHSPDKNSCTVHVFTDSWTDPLVDSVSYQYRKNYHEKVYHHRRYRFVPSNRKSRHGSLTVVKFAIFVGETSLRCYNANNEFVGGMIAFGEYRSGSLETHGGPGAFAFLFAWQTLTPVEQFLINGVPLLPQEVIAVARAALQHFGNNHHVETPCVDEETARFAFPCAREVLSRIFLGVCQSCGLVTTAVRDGARAKSTPEERHIYFLNCHVGFWQQLGKGRRRALLEEPDRDSHYWEADHVIPLMEGGLRSITNAQLLCVACHDAKSTAERKRAKSIRTSSE
jgi:hypothetical protein